MLNYNVLPENLRNGMQCYVEHHIKPGDFLTACLANDFIDAVGRASTKSYDYIHSVALFLYNELPGRTYPDSPWGSYEAITKWVSSKAEKGKQ